MPVQRISLTLTELRCIAQAEGRGGSEPYLWTTFFAFGAQQQPFQSGPMAVVTPSYDAFRTEFPNGMTAGQAVPVPTFIASASFDIDLESVPQPKIIGAIAVLLEEDDTPESSMVLGRIAYSKEIEKQLNDLASRRIHDQDYGPLRDEEVDAIKSAVESKVKDAVGSNQSIWNFFRDQDDILGFVYKSFNHPPAQAGDPDIVFQYFDFPEIGNGSSNRFTLTGRLSLGPVPSEPVDLCKNQRAALKAMQDAISGLQQRRSVLQQQLHHATPQQKAGIVAEIEATDDQITADEAQLPALQQALEQCQHRFAPNEDVGGPGDVLVTQ